MVTQIMSTRCPILNKDNKNPLEIILSFVGSEPEKIICNEYKDDGGCGCYPDNLQICIYKNGWKLLSE
ncbi:MAG: hypothetical protein KJ674_01340 [Nanoarchaeota archaeon]|nr:hypothetical protein [Nanoarchaeota archaeon]